MQPELFVGSPGPFFQKKVVWFWFISPYFQVFQLHFSHFGPADASGQISSRPV